MKATSLLMQSQADAIVIERKVQTTKATILAILGFLSCGLLFLV